MLIIVNKLTGGENIQKSINFDVMITPMIIKILFWVGVAASIIFGLLTSFRGLSMMFSGFQGAFLEGFITIIVVLFIIAGGTIATRIYCELIIIFFKMVEKLTSIDEKLNDQNKIL